MIIALVMILAISCISVYSLSIPGIKTIKTYPINRDAFIDIVCIEGYQYAIFIGGLSGNLVQMFEGGLTGGQPIKCSK